MTRKGYQAKLIRPHGLSIAFATPEESLVFRQGSHHHDGDNQTEALTNECCGSDMCTLNHCTCKSHAQGLNVFAVRLRFVASGSLLQNLLSTNCGYPQLQLCNFEFLCSQAAESGRY